MPVHAHCPRTKQKNRYGITIISVVFLETHATYATPTTMPMISTIAIAISFLHLYASSRENSEVGASSNLNFRSFFIYFHLRSPILFHSHLFLPIYSHASVLHIHNILLHTLKLYLHLQHIPYTVLCCFPFSLSFSLRISVPSNHRTSVLPKSIAHLCYTHTIRPHTHMHTVVMPTYAYAHASFPMPRASAQNYLYTPAFRALVGRRLRVPLIQYIPASS
jgi:hypothetical protein